MVSLMYPVSGRVTQGFGENPQNYVQFGLQGHNGIDFACSIGTSVKAAEEGEVIRAKWDNTGYGNYVKIQHEDLTYGVYYTLYAHLSSYAVSVGQRIMKGQVLGYSGNTGNSTGPHLHFELELPWSRNYGYNNRVDPTSYFTGGGNQVTTTPPVSYSLPVQKGKARVEATAGLNIRVEPNKYAISLGTASYGTLIDWDGEVVEDVDGVKWLKLNVYASADWLKYNDDEEKDNFISGHKMFR